MEQVINRYQAMHVSSRAIVLMLCAVFAFSLTDASTKYITQYCAVPQIVWIRYLVHVVLMLVWLAPRMGRGLVRTARPYDQILRATLLMGSTLCNFGALAFLPLAEVKAISFISPLLVSLLAAWILKEHVGLNRWLAVMLGFSGVLFILRPGTAMLSWASTLALGRACCYSLYQIMTRRISEVENPLTTVFFTALAGTVILAFVAPIVWRPIALIHLPLFFLLGLAGAGGHFLLIKALEKEQAWALSPYGYTQLVWVSLWGFVLFGQLPNGHTLIGMCIIAAGGLYVASGHRVRRNEEPESAIE